MLVFLSAELEQCIAQRNLSDNQIAGLEQIARSARTGKHLILGHMNVLESLGSFDRLGEISRAYYKASANRSVQQFSVFDHAEIYVKVGIQENGITANLIDGKTCIVIPLEQFNSHNFSNATTLLLERESDHQFLKCVWDKYLLDNFLQNVNVVYEVDDGPGGNTVNKYSRLQEACDRLCLCILDSDRLYPGGPCSRTAQDVANSDRSDIHTIRYQILEVHEMENLIPMSVLHVVADAMGGSPHSFAHRLLRALGRLADNGKPEVYLHWDSKKGIICNGLSDEGSRAFWKGHYEEIKNIFPKQCNRIDCNSSSCERLLIPAWPFPAEALSAAKFHQNHFTLPRDELLSGIWIRLGRQLFSWGMADTPRIT
jgi:hypothetical protein